MDAVTIREATPADAQAVVALIRGLAEFEALPGPDANAAGRFAEHLADADRMFEVFVAETSAGLAGYALYFLTYSTFRVEPKLYLEDLFVLPSHRNLGIGRELFLLCARAAVRRRCCRMEWAVLDWNEAAQRFYSGLGGAPDAEWQLYGVHGETLLGLAQTAPGAHVVIATAD